MKCKLATVCRGIPHSRSLPLRSSGCGYATYISNHCFECDASFDPRMYPGYYSKCITLAHYASPPAPPASFPPSLDATHRDTDGSGAIDFDEFVILYGKIKAGGSGQAGKGMFGSLMSGVKSQWKENMPAVVGGDGDDGESKRDVVSFTEDEVENLRTVFEQMDEDGSGEVRFQHTCIVLINSTNFSNDGMRKTYLSDC